MRSTNEEVQAVRDLLDMAGLEPEALIVLEGTEKQQNYAGDIRIQALAAIWTQDIKESYLTARMAQALIAAANRHTTSSWWIDNKTITFNAAYYTLLKKDIKEEYANLA